MKSIGLYRRQLRSSTFHFTDLFPPKDSMRSSWRTAAGRMNWTADKYCRYFLTV
jgi:hypothetical protein